MRLEVRMDALTDLHAQQRAMRCVLTSGWKMTKELLNALQDATTTTDGATFHVQGTLLNFKADLELG